jgi:recombination protein RecT
VTDQGAHAARQQVSEASRGELATQESVTLRELVTRNQAEIAKALPSGDAERYARLVLTELRKNPKLLQCSPQSFIGSVLTAAQLGLEFGPLQQAFMVPYGREITLQIGYRGWLALMNRSSEIQSVSVRTVYEKDHFYYEFGLDERLEHRPATGDRGPVVGYYCVIRKTNGGRSFETMTRSEVEAHRDRYARKSGGVITGPWKDNFDEMAKKTVFLKAKTWLPVNAETQVAALVDTHVINKMTAAEEPEALPDDDDVVEGEIVESDADRADREWREAAGTAS